jgi:hypothetical protein
VTEGEQTIVATLDVDATFTIQTASSLSYYFNGVDSHVSIAHAAHIDWGRDTPFSFSFWSNPTDQLRNNTAFGKFSSGTPAITLEGGYNGAFYFRCYNSSGQGFKVYYAAPVHTVGWNHYVLTYSGNGRGTGVSLYKNGVEIAQTSIQVENTGDVEFSNTHPLMIGRWKDNYHHLGYMDEIGIFNKELSSTEVLEMYNNSTGSFEALSFYANCVTWLRCGESDSFPLLYDEIGNSTLTPVNMVAGDITSEVP